MHISGPTGLAKNYAIPILLKEVTLIGYAQIN